MAEPIHAVETLTPAPEAPAAFEGPDAPSKAAAELRERRAQTAPAQKAKYDPENAPEERSVKQAALDHKHGRMVRHAEASIAAGADKEFAVELAQLGEQPPAEVKYIDGRDPREPVPAREAAKDLGDYRAQRRAEHEAALREVMTAEPAEIDATAGQEQPAQQPQEQQQPDPVAHERQRIEHERAVVDHLRNLSSAELAATVEIEQIKSAFADITQYGTFENLARVNPARAQEVLKWDAEVRAREAKLQQLTAQRRAGETVIQHQRQVAEAQEIQKLHKATDAIMEREVPELADPSRAPQFKAAVAEHLKSVGVTAERLRNDVALQRQLADPDVQRLIVDAVRWRTAQEKARTVQRRPMPSVQRPGVSNHSGGHHDNIERLNKRLDGASNSQQGVRAAAQILAARRAAAR